MNFLPSLREQIFSEVNLQLDAVIWTNLPPKFTDIPGRILTIDKAIEYLRLLDSDTKKLAEEYIRRTPKQIKLGSDIDLRLNLDGLTLDKWQPIPGNLILKTRYFETFVTGVVSDNKKSP